MSNSYDMSIEKTNTFHQQMGKKGLAIKFKYAVNVRYI